LRSPIYVYSANVGSDEKLLVRDGSVWVEREPSPGLAAKLSRDHGTIAVEWSIHTAVDQIWIVAYRAGEVVRELRYAVSAGWTKRGKALPFEDTARLGKFLRKRRLLASPDGYEVLDAFLGKQPPAPVIDPGATYDTCFSPAQASELSAIAERASVRVSVVVETCWHLAKQVIYDRRMARATKLGLDLTMLVDDTSPPPPTESLPAFVHEPIDAGPIELTRYSDAISHQLALSAQMLAELRHMSTMFDASKYDLLDEVYLEARPRVIVRN
jgi:hypothetical protein